MQTINFNTFDGLIAWKDEKVKEAQEQRLKAQLELEQIAIDEHRKEKDDLIQSFYKEHPEFKFLKFQVEIEKVELFFEPKSIALEPEEVKIKSKLVSQQRNPEILLIFEHSQFYLKCQITDKKLRSFNPNTNTKETQRLINFAYFLEEMRGQSK